MLAIRFIIYILPVVSEVFRVFSATIRDNKLIATYNSFDSLNTEIIVYELKEGTTKDIFDSRKAFGYGSVDRAFALNFMDIPDNLQEDNNKLWLKFDLQIGQSFNYPNISSFVNWVGYINLDNMTLEDGSNLFQFPTYENFPIGMYTLNAISNKFGSALYVTGGYIYNKNNDTYLPSSSFFKYNLTTKEWIDISYLANVKLEPVVEHKSVVIDNRFLVILGGEKAIYPINGFSYYSLYNLTVFDTFTNSWENVTIKPDIMDTSIVNFQFYNFIPTVYNDKIMVLGGTTNDNRTRYTDNRYLGILDFKSKIWTWIPILNEDGSSYNLKRNNHDLVVFNDQLIILSDYITDANEIPILIYDIPSQRIKSTLRLPHTSNIKYSDKSMPTYSIVLIALSCTTLLLAVVYLLYRKYKKTRNKHNRADNNGPIREVWSSPDIHNTNNILMDNITCVNVKED
ncbi:hypothetical protein CONCODRAFT_13956 [Conidiobolus coronatus NRRL 28638]|uniref:Galactose oxidase n=1 Tax=Conidiobolus coronatus (strain ATCC 28846 / CBS 209.66 / NRRL 28638) TaxID=796925 RepID=A0A137NPY9_CONC2|nr:hypothetical protein CONCODRAFT_13956 [Conidiobolus coronatus NRRL 28638]|eukprot:KXN64770.1 hypothetical protein CONCODRAFT_13956 [Conidiobolus coronatus NRRL 28638]